MSADALNGLIDSIPNWLTRLDELDDQIEQRQTDLAKIAGANSSSPRSLRNRGSTESLKPKDDDPEDETQHVTADENANTNANTSSDTRPTSSTQKEKREVVATAQRRARAVVHRKEKTDSMLSTEDVAQKYRSKAMVIVYYDSWVQSFFEELVKFVSGSRNLMRKAKMAAKVAEIKRLAELEFPDDDDDDSEADQSGLGSRGLVVGSNMITADTKLAARTGPADDDETPEELRQRFLATRNMSPAARMAVSRGAGRVSRAGLGASGGFQGGRRQPQQGDIYDQLDKGLEFVQSACEQGAHQFLREGDCTEQIQKIKARLSTTHENARKELDRQNGASITAVEERTEETRPRVFRPMTMRRDDDVQKLKADQNMHDSGHDSGHDSDQGEMTSHE